MAHLKFKHPFNLIASGPSGSGKTCLVRKLLKHYKKTTTISKSPLIVLWLHGQDQELYSKPIDSNVSVKYLDYIPTEEKIKEIAPQIIVVDDLMIEISRNKFFSDFFTKKSHHLNISILFLLQNLFVQGPYMRNISLNAHYMILLKNVRDKLQISALGRQLFAGKSKIFEAIYEDATSLPYSYLLVDLKPCTPDKLRLRGYQDASDNIKSYIRPQIYEIV